MIKLRSAWSCDCIVKEMVWNRSEEVGLVAYKYNILVCTARFWNHQNDKKFGPVSAKVTSAVHRKMLWDYTNIWHKNVVHIYERRHLKSRGFQGTFFL